MVRDLCQKKIRTGSPPVVGAYDILVRIIYPAYEQLGLHSSCFHVNFDCIQCLICTTNSPKMKAITARVISSRTRRKVTRKCQNVLFRVIRWAVQRDFSRFPVTGRWTCSCPTSESTHSVFIGCFLMLNIIE